MRSKHIAQVSAGTNPHPHGLATVPNARDILRARRRPVAIRPFPRSPLAADPRVMSEESVARHIVRVIASGGAKTQVESKFREPESTAQRVRFHYGVVFFATQEFASDDAVVYGDFVGSPLRRSLSVGQRENFRPLRLFVERVVVDDFFDFRKEVRRTKRRVDGASRLPRRRTSRVASALAIRVASARVRGRARIRFFDRNARRALRDNATLAAVANDGRFGARPLDRRSATPASDRPSSTVSSAVILSIIIRIICATSPSTEKLRVSVLRKADDHKSGEQTKNQRFFRTFHDIPPLTKIMSQRLLKTRFILTRFLNTLALIRSARLKVDAMTPATEARAHERGSVRSFDRLFIAAEKFVVPVRRERMKRGAVGARREVRVPFGVGANDDFANAIAVAPAVFGRRRENATFDRFLRYVAQSSTRSNANSSVP